MKNTASAGEKSNRPRAGPTESPAPEPGPGTGSDPGPGDGGRRTRARSTDPNLVVGALGVAAFLVIGAVGLYRGGTLGLAESWSLPTGITRETVFATGTAMGIVVALLNPFGGLWRRTAPIDPSQSRVIAGLLAMGVLVPVGLLLQVFLPMPVGVVALGGVCLTLAMALVVVTEHRNGTKGGPKARREAAVRAGALDQADLDLFEVVDDPALVLERARESAHALGTRMGVEV